MSEWLFELHPPRGKREVSPLAVKRLLKALGRRFGLRVSFPGARLRTCQKAGAKCAK